MEKRKRVIQFALEGQTLKAIELTEQLAPNLLEKNKDLHFDLLSLHFVELIYSRKCTEALEFAQTKLTPFGKVQKFVINLEDFMALLAYVEPEKAPMFHLLSLEYRQQFTTNLNRAILDHANKPSYSTMEKLIQQTTIVRQSLNQELGKDACEVINQGGNSDAMASLMNVLQHVRWIYIKCMTKLLKMERLRRKLTSNVLSLDNVLGKGTRLSNSLALTIRRKGVRMQLTSNQVE